MGRAEPSGPGRTERISSAKGTAFPPTAPRRPYSRAWMMTPGAFGPSLPCRERSADVVTRGSRPVASSVLLGAESAVGVPRRIAEPSAFPSAARRRRCRDQRAGDARRPAAGHSGSTATARRARPDRSSLRSRAAQPRATRPARGPSSAHHRARPDGARPPIAVPRGSLPTEESPGPPPPRSGRASP